jgi:hypothetical protein
MHHCRDQGQQQIDSGRTKVEGFDGWHDGLMVLIWTLTLSSGAAPGFLRSAAGFLLRGCVPFLRHF